MSDRVHTGSVFEFGLGSAPSVSLTPLTKGLAGATSHGSAQRARDSTDTQARSGPSAVTPTRFL